MSDRRSGEELGRLLDSCGAEACGFCGGTGKAPPDPTAVRLARLRVLRFVLGMRWGFGARGLPVALLAAVLGISTRSAFNYLGGNRAVPFEVAERVESWQARVRADLAWREYVADHPDADPSKQPASRRPLPPAPKR